jgi:tetratricopeptide (TPR) repeat protein
VPSSPPDDPDAERADAAPPENEPHRANTGASEEAEPASNGAAYCTECGTAFAPNDKFCSQCGTPRTESSRASAAPEGTRPVAADLPEGTAGSASPKPEDQDAASEAIDESAINRKLAWLVGGAAVVIATLFLVTLFSERAGDPLARTAAERNAGDNIGQQQSGRPGPGGAGASSTAPASVDALIGQYSPEMNESLTARVDSLREAAESEEGIMRQTLQQEIVNAYIGAGHLGRAAQVQKTMAEDSGDPDAWRRTGDLLYSWMEQLGRGNTSNAIAQVAPHVVDAYERVLEQEPGNLDVRTDMATAMLQTNSPMRGVEQINRVLEEDPEHFQARFNKGIMQLYIGRVDEAVAEFEEVKRIVGEDSPYYERADQAITLAREEEARAREEGNAPTAQPPAAGMATPTPEADSASRAAPAAPNP